MTGNKETLAAKKDLPADGGAKRNRAGRRPDCVTETRMGNTVLVVSGFFKQGASATADDRMIKVLEAETIAGHGQEYTA